MGKLVHDLVGFVGSAEVWLDEALRRGWSACFSAPRTELDQKKIDALAVEAMPPGA